jgi:hypothetical protein
LAIATAKPKKWPVQDDWCRLPPTEIKKGMSGKVSLALHHHAVMNSAGWPPSTGFT